MVRLGLVGMWFKSARSHRIEHRGGEHLENGLLLYISDAYIFWKNTNISLL